MLSKLKTLVSVGLLIAVLVVFLGSSCAVETEFHTMATSGIGGVWFIVGATLTTQWNAGIPDVMWSCDTRGGGNANPYWLALGKVDAAIAHGVGMKAAMEGIGFFKDKGSQDLSHVRSMAGLHKSYLHIVVKKDVSFECLEDLVGHRIAVDQPGSAAQMILTMIPEPWGRNFKEYFKCEYIADYDAIDALLAGRIDAYVCSMGLGGGAVAEAFERADLKLLSVKESIRQKTHEESPIIVTGMVPERIYRNQESLKTLAYSGFVFVQDYLPEKLVYQMCEVMYECLQDGTLVATHRAFKEAGFPSYIEKASLCPLHPGAKAFYEDKGLEIE